MQLHDLKKHTSRKDKKRVGRGGKRGKTSGRGHKGQKSRAGGSPRPELRDTIKKIPKLRGHGTNRPRTVVPNRTQVVVNLGAINDVFQANETVSPETLAEKGLIATKGGKIPTVKILSQGSFTKTCTFTKCNFSESARKKIEEAGGTIA